MEIIEQFSDIVEKNFIHTFFSKDEEERKKQVVESASSIAEVMKKVGMNEEEILNIGIGESSICFVGTDKVVKLTSIDYGVPLSEYTSHSEYILQPLEEKIGPKIGWYQFRTIAEEKLDFTGITYDDVMEVYCHLRDDDYLWYDTKEGNIGRDKNGNLKLFDYGELIYIRDLPPYDQQKEIKSHIAKKPDLDEQYSRYLETKNNSVKK